MREIERGARFFHCFSLDSFLFIIGDKARARGKDLKRCLYCGRQGAGAGQRKSPIKKIFFLFLFSFFFLFARKLGSGLWVFWRDDKMGELGHGGCFAVICARSASARRRRVYKGEWPLSRTVWKTSHFVY